MHGGRIRSYGRSTAPDRMPTTPSPASSCAAWNPPDPQPEPLGVGIGAGRRRGRRRRGRGAAALRRGRVPRADILEALALDVAALLVLDEEVQRAATVGH